MPREHALQGFEGVRAYATDPERSAALLRDTLGFSGGEGGRWEVRGAERGGTFVWDAAPPIQPIPGAGTVHHVAFATRREEQRDWQQRVARSGHARPTPIIDRFYFESVYFREPNGVLFELATMGPGFATDEDPEHLGERLSLPPRFESLPRAGRADADAAARSAGDTRRPLIQVSGLTKRFGDTLAVDDLSFTRRAGPGRRIPGAERRGQDDDPARAAGPRPADERRRDDRGPAVR